MIGATGYIGSVVAEKLQHAGHDLIGLARSPQAQSTLRASGIEPILGSLGDIATISEQAQRCDALIQIATGGYLTELNTDAGHQLRQAADAIIATFAGTGKPYLFTNGTGLYGDTGIINNDRQVSEDGPMAPWYFYAHLPAVIEHLHTSAAAADVRLVELRAGQVYGRRGGYIGPIARRFHGLRQTGIVRTIRSPATFSYVDVDDLADAYLLSLDNPTASGPFNLVQDDVSMMDVCEAVSAFAGPGHLQEVDMLELRERDGWFAAVDFAASVRANADKARCTLGWRPYRPGLVEHLGNLRSEYTAEQVYPGPKLSGVTPSVVPGETHS